MAAPFTAPTPKHRAQNQDDWSIREKLTLASSVLRSGDQNWVSVSRAVKPVTETGCCSVKRPPDFFSQKNCAIHYSEMLEKVSTPKRKRTNEGGGAETPGEQIVRKLTFERIEELKKSIRGDHMTYRNLKMRIEDIRNGKLDAQLPAVWEEIQARKRRAEELQSQAASLGMSAGGDNLLHPLNPLAPLTPMSAPAPLGLKQGTLATPSPQKGKQLRIPKPTPKFQKYQQQLQQRHGQGGQHLQAGHPMSPGNMGEFGRGGDNPALSYGAESLKSEPMDIDPGAAVQTVSVGNTPGMMGNMMQTSTHPTQQSPIRSSMGRRSSSVSSQGQSESSLLSLLSQPPKDGKGDMEQQAKKELESSVQAEPQISPRSQGNQDNQQATDGKSFLGVTSPMETKKLDSIRDRIAPPGGGTGEPPSISAPTLSKLLSSSGSHGNSAPSSVDKSSESGITVDVKIGSDSSMEGRGPIAVGGRGQDGGGVVLSISVNPKEALSTTLPSPMAITPPLTSPPSDKKEMLTSSIVQAVDAVVIKSDTRSSIEGSNTKRESDMSLLSTTEQQAPADIKIEIVDTPQPSPRLIGRSRAPKPGRPGRPPRGGRRSQRQVTKQTTSTDNDTEEEHEEDTKSESMEAESEKTSERDDEDMESTISEKKDSDDDDEQESVDDGSESGIKDDSFLDRASTIGSESVPTSPASQMSIGDEIESVQAQKTWRKSIMLVWRAAANHKYANVFLHPVTDDEAPGYHGVVFRPMDLSTIKKNIENGSIRTTSEFQRDMMLMFQNALMYNSADHDVFRMAEEMRDDVMDQIQSYIATQLMVQSSDRDSKMLRGHRSDGTRLQVNTRLKAQPIAGTRQEKRT